ncbi:hypothetical protein D7Y13_16625 [Corallococcus praedator]|uniref:Uncharacterized protein n=1 Tax=Corallococcus praedator TaxID=2316724 RepID=A0ABX9QK21_9BACT|nr:MULTISPECIES: hypothetical protein [Corallococcus]RKH33993.1 hypothetical protein D7X75_09800 [Corallococcus sp. CA031C]RKI08071.1 hypothetical protein D7Y13_16625 [Corallococcus praedator]
MTNNVKRFLAASLLSLMPSVALAEHYDISGLLAHRGDYVSLRPTETIQLPSGRLEGAATLAGTTVDTFFVANWTGVNTFPGYTLTGTPNILPPNPLAPTAPPSISGVFQMGVGQLTPVTQTYYYTTNAADPTGAAKTCLWQLNVTVSGTVCSGTLNMTAYGNQGVLCSIDTAQTFVDPATCQAQVVTIIQ